MAVDHKNTVARIAERLKDELAVSIDAIVLYGSVARGEATEESDVDIFLLCKDPKSLRRELDPVLDAFDPTRALISPVCMTVEGLESRLERGEYFAGDVLREGVVLYDSGAYRAIRARWKGKMRQPSRELIQAHLRLADESLRLARSILDMGGERPAANEAYHATYNAAQAIIMSRPIRPPRTHSGLNTVFTREIIDAGIISQEFRGHLGTLFKLRQEATYDVRKDISRESVEQAIQMAEAFVAAVRNALDFD